jgi:hypothetical protein
MSGPTLSSYSSCPAVLVPSGVPPSSMAPNAPIVVTSVPTGKSSKINSGAIVGIVIGVIALVALFAFWIWKSDQRKRQNPVVVPNTPLPEPSPATSTNKPSTPSDGYVASSKGSEKTTGNDIDASKNSQPSPPPPTGTLNEENRIKPPPHVPLDSPPPLTKPTVPSQ